MGKLAIDITTIVISNLVYARPAAGQYPPEDQYRWLRTSPRPQPQDTRSVSIYLLFNHCVQVANRVSKRYNVLKALADTNWGQQRETLLITYKALGRSIANYAAPVWSTNSSESNIGKIQRAQNEALRIITGSHNMASIDHLHSEPEMLQVENNLNLLSVQYLIQCLDTTNACHHITKMELPPREMKETIFTRHNQTLLPPLANNRKDTLQALHTSFVNTAMDNMKDNRLLNNWPPPINDEETPLSRRQRTTLSQLRSGHCELLNSYKKRLKQSDSSSCPDCGMDPQDVPHLFDCMAHPNVTCELMGQASQDDTGTELSGPGQPGLPDEDGWQQGHLIQAHIPPLSNCKDTGEEPSSLHNSKHTKHAHATRVQTQHSTVTALHILNNTVAKRFNQMAPLREQSLYHSIWAKLSTQ